MKKTILIITFMALVFLGLTNVKAASESELLSKLSQGYIVDGETVKAPDYQINEAKRYLNKYEVSETDCDFIISKIDEIYELAKNEKAKSFTELSSSGKSKAVSVVAEISSKTSVKATLTKNGILTIYESDGKTVFAEIIDKDITKQTGLNNVVLITISIVSVLGIV